MTTSMTTSNSERRHHPRYLAPKLCVSLLSITSKSTHSENSVVKSNSNDGSNTLLRTLDFNHLGMSVHSQQHFNIGDILHLVLSNSSGHREEVSCFVCNRARTDIGYRSGLHFLYTHSDSENAHKQNNFSTAESLLAIEQTLDTINN